MIHFFEVKYSSDLISLTMLWNNTYSAGLCVYRKICWVSALFQSTILGASGAAKLEDLVLGPLKIYSIIGNS